MNTFWKVAIGFLGGVIFTIVIVGVLILAFVVPHHKSSLQERREEIKKRNIQYFELSTSNGDIKLHTYMPKDSVKILMGKPNSIDVNNMGIGVHETWRYKGSNRYTDEFRFEFFEGELESVNQYKE